MLLKVRLPTSIPQIPQIPKMSMPPLPLSMSDVDLTLSVLPSSSTILLSLVAVFVLTSFVRALWIGMREHLALVKQKRKGQQHPTPAQSLTLQSEKSVAAAPEQIIRQPASSWLWGLVRWDSLPPLRAPAVHSEESTFRNEKQEWSPQPQFSRRPPMVRQVSRRSGPAFDRPLPTLYESDIPVSMAKIIMSRHTFRRPSSRPPPARSASSVQIQRRTPLLPPQPSSSLSRPPSPPSRSPSPPSPSSSRSSSRSNSRSPSPPRLSPPPVGPSTEDSLRSSGSIV